MCKTRVNALTKKKNTEGKGKNTLKMFISLFFLMSLYIPKLKNEFSLLFFYCCHQFYLEKTLNKLSSFS